MGEEIYTDTEIQIDAAVSAQKYSAYISEDLGRLDRDVDDLRRVWTGGSADAYGQSWVELKTAIDAIVHDLHDIGTLVGESARDYHQAETENASTFTSTKVLRL